MVHYDTKALASLAGRLTIAMNGEVFIARGQQREFPNQLLGKLLGSVDIIAARGDHRQPVGCHVGLGNHLCAGLCCRIGICGLQCAVLCRAYKVQRKKSMLLQQFFLLQLGSYCLQRDVAYCL